MAVDTDIAADGDGDDEREIEMDSITAIFPEMALDPKNKFMATMDIPVVPLKTVPVIFRASQDTSIAEDPNPATELPAEIPAETHNLSHLPSLHLQITLPDGYPSKNAPIFQLSTNPAWLSQDILTQLENDGPRLWEEFGHDQVVYSYIDHLQQASETVFGVLDDSPYLEVSHEHQISLLDYDIKAKRAAFEIETFECGICLDPKKGVVCHRMLDCGHVFCRQCLQDFYNSAITEGDLSSIKCLAPDCAKRRAAAANPTGKRRKPKTHISPSELLQIPIDHDMVKRYVRLKHKAELESDKNTIYCPRKWCQGAARSKKHRKPSQDLEKVESSDEESEDESGPTTRDPKSKINFSEQLLSICEDCSFAFCSRCYQGWHGVDKRYCIPRKITGELTDEDKASLHYLQMHSTPCPTCDARAQKTEGCNHMICFKCDTHFCYLCSSWLPPENPYQHFNNESTGCYMRLWELQNGDGDDADAARRPQGDQHNEHGNVHDGDNHFNAHENEWDINFEEAPAHEVAGPRIGLLEFLREDPVQVMEVLVDPEPEPRFRWRREPIQPRPVIAPLPEPVDVAREGPLVLRLAVPPPPPPQVPDPPPAVPAPPHRRRNNARNLDAQAPRAARRAPVPGAVRRAPLPVAVRRVGVAEGRELHPIPGQPHHIQDVPNHHVPALNDDGPAPEAAGIEGQRAWIQRFVQMALRDEEDQMEGDSDEDEFEEAFDIPMR